MKKIEIAKELGLEDVVDILSLETRNQFIYKEESDGIRCLGPFYVHGRYSTINEVKDFNDVFEFDIFASNYKLDGEDFQLAYTGYDYSVSEGGILTLYFDVYGVYEEDVTQKDMIETDMEYEEAVDVEDPLDFSSMEELFEERDNVVTSYSFVVVKKNDSYESIAQRYNVDVKALREVNKDKSLNEKDLVVLPYSKTN